MQYFVTLRMLKSGFASLMRVLWRPGVGAVCMYLALQTARSAMNAASASASGQWLDFLMLVGLGMIVYISVTSGLWRISGCPVGAESVILDRLRPVWSRFATRFG